MREASCVCEATLHEGTANPCGESTRNDQMERIAQALHDLCQPLTTLQCRLELAGVVGTDEAHREAVRQGLKECERVVESVGCMRELVRAART